MVAADTAGMVTSCLELAQMQQLRDYVNDIHWLNYHSVLLVNTKISFQFVYILLAT